MRLSTQMLTGIVGITLLSQVIFALIAYRIVVGVEQDHIAQLLGHRTNEVAQSIAVPLATGIPESQALEQSRRHFAPTVDVMVLVDTQGVVASAGPWVARVDTTRLRNRIEQLDLREPGHILIDGNQFITASQPVPGLPYRVVALQQSQITRDNLSAKLGSRFLVFSIIIIWIAVWTALLLAAAINRKLEAKSIALRHQVTHDVLTGLPNRALLYKKIETIIASPEDIDMQLVVLAISINHFMEITDTLGHDLGDQLLLEMGGRLRQALPEDALVSRLGGDEFAVVLLNSGREKAEQSIRQLVTSMDKRVSVTPIELDIGLTIGAVLYPKQASDADALLRYANVALQQAHERCTSFLFYDGSKDNHSIRRLKLGAELSHAIDCGQLVVFYQPKILATSGEVCGLEALVRWNHPEYGLIPPDEFISMAEQTGAIQELTAWVMEESLHFLRRLHSRGMPITIAVNISSHNLRDDRLKLLVEELLQHTGIAGHYLYLEVTEKVMMQDIHHDDNVLCALHSLGIKISIDDFGTGFSSLAHLNRLPVDEIKVDRSFVMPMRENHNEQAIVASIIQLAHTLDCSVVAEGVENTGTFELLKAMDCDIIQGYLLTEPRPPQEIERWLDAYEPDSIQNDLPRLHKTIDSA